jgi:Domain of unknown function (DUF4388)
MKRPLMIIGADPEAERVVELLVAEGYELITSAPEKVVGDLARHKPRLLVFQLDEGAARADELMQRIQATAYGAAVPVVFFGPAPGPNLAEVVVLGGDLFLPSPVDPEKLVSSIRRLGGAPPTPKVEAPSSATADPRDAEGAQDSGGRKSTTSMAKGANDLAPGSNRPAKIPEPLGVDDLEDLSRIDSLAMPWDDRSTRDRDAKSAEMLPTEGEPDLLKEAMAADLMLDPRNMALTITTLVPELDAFDKDLPSAEEVTAAPRSTPPAPLALADKSPLVTAEGDLSAVDAIVQDFMSPGGDGDTVAVRIRRTINAFEEQIVVPPSELSHHGLTPPPSPPVIRPSGGLPRPPQAEGDEDEIDLDALDVDRLAGAYEVDPDRVLQELADGLGASASASGPLPPVNASIAPGGTEVSHPGRLPPEPTPGDAPDGDGSAAFSPASKNAYTESRKVPAPEEPSPHGTIADVDIDVNADADAPLASPYDLPPVVSAQGFEYVDPRGGLPDVVDTVPGRRTSIHIHPSAVLGSPEKPAIRGRGAGENTQPAKALGVRGNRKSGPARSDAANQEQPPSRQPPSRQPPSRQPPSDPAISGPSPSWNDPSEPRTPPEVPVRLREGTLAEMDPASLIQAVASHELDGALEITSPDARYELFFDQGVPRLAQSSRVEDRMVEMLRHQGRITAGQLRECEAEIAGGRRAGAVLLDRGWIKPAELIPTVRRHFQDLVNAVFSLEEGTFRFDAHKVLPDEIVYLEQPPAALLFEGIRSKYSTKRIIALAGGEEIIPVTPPDADERRLAGAKLSGRDWRIIDAMDGRSSITAVAERLDAKPRDVWGLAWGLACLGQLKLQHKVEGPVVDNRRTQKLPDVPQTESPAEPPAAPPPDRDLDLDVERVLDRHALVREGDYFACLGVAPQASVHELRHAYELARSQFDPRELHPAVSTDYSQELQEILVVIEEAYSVLRDNTLRETYRSHVVRPVSAEEAP